MRFLILSDIHANWEALEAVLSSASGEYDRIVCCGDLIGYGPDPNRVVDWVRENVATVIRGNHDKVTLGAEEVEQAFAYLDRDLTFFGHTHVQGGFTSTRRRARMISGVRWDEESAALDLNPDDVYLINPGAIGQPRDGDPRAAYVLYDTEDRYVLYCRQEYDISAVQAKIRRAGLPDILAERLAVGQ